MKMSFTGTQRGMTKFQKEELAKRLIGCSELCNGACIGADEEAIEIALKEGIRIFHLYPSYIVNKQSAVVKAGSTMGEYKEFELEPWGKIRIKIEQTAAPLTRNLKIINESEVLIACPKEHKHTLRSGTWATIRKAWHAKKRVVIIPPIEREDNNEQPTADRSE